ncbi:MAG: hypothetical protein KGI77_07635 [Gammaproteobacteria bacterium]|nr:hypothetical protein [Gammaproteobacteria bacterium]MDE1984420.1 hypothetical protein [Gammaproteobacteria bacterium]MDE2108560.1 hypothetical protein [Gammaproteobacteria bacterium]
MTQKSAVGILAPLDFEARSAQILVQHGWQLRVSGMGVERARAAAEQMLASGVRRLLVWGTAGGLAPALQVGSLFLPDVLNDAQSGTRHEVSAAFHNELESALTQLDIPLIRSGILVTTTQPLFTPSEKAQAARESGALMVDMEAAAVAAVAAQAGAEFAVLRVLLDDAGASLPSTVVAAIETRHPHISVMTGLLKRPQELPAVLRLGRSFQHAHRSLTAAAAVLATAQVNRLS